MSNMPFSSTLRTLALLTLLTVNVGASGLTSDQQDLIDAVANKDANKVKNLLNNEPKPSAAFLNEHELLERAYTDYRFNNGPVEIVKALIEAGADVRVNYIGKPLLHDASEKGDYDMVTLLFEHNADIDAIDVTGSTPLHWASKNGHTNITRFLLEKGANPSVQNQKEVGGDTPLHFASDKGYLGIATCLVKYKANMDLQDEYGRTPLHWALGIDTRDNHHKIAALLINNQANMDLQDQYGDTPLHWAMRNKYYGIARLLIEKGANTNIKANNGRKAQDEVYETSIHDPEGHKIKRALEKIEKKEKITKVIFVLLCITACGVVSYFIFSDKEETPKHKSQKSQRKTATKARYKDRTPAQDSEASPLASTMTSHG